MFGHVWLEIEPNPGGGVEFAEKVVGGSVPKGFFPGIEKGIREAAAEGVLAGYPLSDFKATLYDGSFHTVDSNELSFKIAASMALKKGVLDCKPGAARADHGGRGPRPRGVHGRRQPRPQHAPRPGPRDGHARDGMQVVQAQVPQAELFSYATELRSLTHGRGTFTATLDHYEEVPQHIAEKVIERPPQGSRGGRRPLTRISIAASGGRQRPRSLRRGRAFPRRSRARRSRRRSRDRARPRGPRSSRSRPTR